jgi:hypothetical protein
MFENENSLLLDHTAAGEATLHRKVSTEGYHKLVYRQVVYFSFIFQKLKGVG